jgi:hypothetical protein
MYGGEGLCKWSGPVASSEDSVYENHCHYNETALSSATVAGVLTCLVAALGITTLIRIISCDWMLAQIFSKNPTKRNYQEYLKRLFDVMNVRKKVILTSLFLPYLGC